MLTIRADSIVVTRPCHQTIIMATCEPTDFKMRSRLGLVERFHILWQGRWKYGRNHVSDVHAHLHYLTINFADDWMECGWIMVGWVYPLPLPSRNAQAPKATPCGLKTRVRKKATKALIPERKNNNHTGKLNWHKLKHLVESKTTHNGNYPKQDSWNFTDHRQHPLCVLVQKWM